MTLALVSFKARGIEYDEVLTKNFKQSLVISLTGANTDLTVDFGDYSGALFTALNSTPAGIIVAKALKDIQVAALQFKNIDGEVLFGKTQVAAAAAATDVVKTMNATNTHLPKLVYFTASAPLAATYVLEWVLANDQLPIAVEG